MQAKVKKITNSRDNCGEMKDGNVDGVAIVLLL